MTEKETQRLRKLKSYNMLDTSRDPSFDKIAKLASAICETPIALISLVDDHRQWFKSAIGLEGIRETERNISFCTFTIQGSGVLEVTDAHKDERFKNNPLVTEAPKIRFYAGAPLTSPDGHNLGTLCVIDQKPHKLTAEQTEALKILSDQVVELMELRKTNTDLKKAQKLLEDQQQLVVNKARLQSIGELAAGVCHQINNPLAIITGRSMILRSILKEKLPGNPEVLKELEVIDHTAQRVSEILKALRMYAKDFGDELSEENLSDLVENVLTLMKGKLQQEKVQVNFTREKDGKVFVNKNQITQTILDLLSNSVEALEETPEKVVDIELVDEGETISLKVKDIGKGIRPEDESKIFQPFFTTKGRHFGVGLSNAQSFAKQNKGGLTLSRAKNPTIFELKLPKSA